VSLCVFSKPLNHEGLAFLFSFSVVVMANGCSCWCVCTPTATSSDHKQYASVCCFRIGRIAALAQLAHDDASIDSGDLKVNGGAATGYITDANDESLSLSLCWA
jgi:hypothetical protein